MLFISCQLHTNAYNCANIDIVLKYLSYCNYSKHIDIHYFEDKSFIHENTIAC